MAYGGGTWNPPVQNKVLSGTYICFSSKARPSNIFGERGFVACGLNLSFGLEDEIITVEPSDLQRESLELFGLEYTDKELLPLRELLAHAKTAYIYRLNGGGEKAKASLESLTITAKHSGTKGNEFVVIIANNVDEEEKFDVTLKIGTLKVYEKVAVKGVEELSDCPYVEFKGTLTKTLGANLSGGTNGEETTKAHTDFLEKLEKKYINVVAYAGTDEAIKRMYKSYVERRVNLEGAYFQAALYNFDANSELVINVASKAKENEAGLVYWVAGAEAGCEINRTVGNDIYDGEYTIDLNMKQRDLISAIRKGQFVFHEVDNKARVLSDINSFTDFSVKKNEDFSKNQIIRVLHQVGNDISTIFNTRYLDKEQNNEMGRNILWNDIYNHALKLQGLGAITNLEPEDIKVELGDTKDAVYCEYLINPVMAMAKLYMHVIVE